MIGKLTGEDFHCDIPLRLLFMSCSHEKVMNRSFFEARPSRAFSVCTPPEYCPAELSPHSIVGPPYLRTHPTL